MGTTAVFVHGIFGSKDTWATLSRLLAEDNNLSSLVRTEIFEYASPKLSLSPLRRIPTLKDAANKLDTWLTSRVKSEQIILVGHSQGGLVIQLYLSMLLANAVRLEDLRRIRAVVMFATPNTGSELFLSLRKGLEALWSHPQERQLRPYDEAIEDARRKVYERVVVGMNGGDNPTHDVLIRFFVYAGESDGVVQSRSAHWMFPGAGTLPGDHFSIIKPSSRDDVRYGALHDALRWAVHSLPAERITVVTEGLDVNKLSELQNVIELEGDAFLPNEGVRPEDLKHWISNYQYGWALRLSIIVAKINSRVCGFMMFHEGANLIIVDYIATEDSNPYSSLLVDRMVQQLKMRSRSRGGIPIVFEVAKPQASGEESKKHRNAARISLFQGTRFGARVIGGLDLPAPDMEKIKPGSEAPYLLMYARPGQLPDSLDEHTVRDIIRNIYLVWYTNWFSHYQNAAAIKSYLRDLCGRVENSVKAEHALVTWSNADMQ